MHHKEVMQVELDPRTGNFENGSWKVSNRIPPQFHKHFFKLYTYKGSDVNSPVELVDGKMIIEVADGTSFGTINNGTLSFSPTKSYCRPNVLGSIDHVRIQAQGLKYSTANKADEHNITLRFEIHSFN